MLVHQRVVFILLNGFVQKWGDSAPTWNQYGQAQKLASLQLPKACLGVNQIPQDLSGVGSSEDWACVIHW